MRCMYGPMVEQGVWIIRTNQELRELYKDLDIVLYCGTVPAANALGCTAAEGLLYKPWSLGFPTCTARCLHQRP